MSSPGKEKRLYHCLGVLYLLQIKMCRRARFKVKSLRMPCNGASDVEVNQVHSAATVSQRAKENVEQTQERRTRLVVPRLANLLLLLTGMGNAQ